MTKLDFLEAMTDIDESYIKEAHEYKAKPARSVYMKAAALAACIVIAVSAYAVVALNRDDLPVEKPPVGEDPVVTEVPDEDVVSAESTTTQASTDVTSSDTTVTTTEPLQVTTSEATTSLTEEDIEIEIPAEEEMPSDEEIPVEEAPAEETPVEEIPVESNPTGNWPPLPAPDDPSVVGLLEAEVNRADENPGSGEPISYDHYMDEMFAIRDDLKLLSYEITKVYTPEEAVEIMGEGSEDYYMGITALYEIHVYYDHIAQEAVDYTLLMSRAGNQLRQWAGCPIFGVGERYMSIIYDTEQFEMLPAMSFYLEGEYAYYIDTLTSPENLLCPVDEANPDLNIPMGDEEWWRITTTKNNPVVFHRKFKTEALAEYIRTDWQERRE